MAKSLKSYFLVVNLTTQCVHSRHRTIKTAREEATREDRRIKRANGPKTYFSYRICEGIQQVGECVLDRTWGF